MTDRPAGPRADPLPAVPPTLLDTMRSAGLDATDVPDTVAGDDPEYRASPELVTGLLAERLATLHSCAVSPAAGPVLRPADVVERARAVLAAGGLAAASLPAAYRHVTPARLVDLLADGAVGAEERWSPVPTHGRPTLAHLRCRGGRAIGFTDWDAAAISDRHRDLAVAATEVAASLGPMLVPVLSDRYAAAAPELGPPDPRVLDWYALAHALAPARPS